MNIELMKQKVEDRLDYSEDVADEKISEEIKNVIREMSETQDLSLKEKSFAGRALFNAFRKLDALQDLLDDDSITEIMVNGAEHIFVEKGGTLYETGRRFSSDARLRDVVQQIVSYTNRTVNEEHPIVDARLPDGSRVNVVLPPASLDGPVVTIRKFPEEDITMDRLVAWKSLDRETAEFLKKLVIARYNIFISGGTGSGKTTFLNALSQYITKEERVITIEDNAELRLLGNRNLVRLETRNASIEGTGRITMEDLFKSALRMRPDRIIVGEVRGAEAFSMIEAMSSGHPGSMSTGHANSPEDMLMRLETMILMGKTIPLIAIQRKIASGVDIIVQLGRLRDKTRRVTEIVEVLDEKDGRIRTHTLYAFEETGEEGGVIKGGLVRKDALRNKKKLLVAGYHEA